MLGGRMIGSIDRDELRQVLDIPERYEILLSSRYVISLTGVPSTLQEVRLAQAPGVVLRL
jgi:hypothetical protein